MSVIKVKCPDCGKNISIDIKTIDTLREENRKITKERDDYKSKYLALEMMNRSRPKSSAESISDLFNEFMGGKKKP